MSQIVLVTGRTMPHGPALETPLLVDALADRGVTASIEPWGADAIAAAPLVVIRTTWDYPDDLPGFLGWSRSVASATRLINPIEVIEWNSHKSYLLDLAYAAVPVIPTALVSQGAGDAERRAALQEYEGDVVIKPAVSVGARGVARAAALSDEAAAHLASLTLAGDALVQPFEPTVLDGESSLIFFGGEFSHAVRKVPAAGDFRVQVFHGGTNVPCVASPDELDVAVAALAAVPGELACARVDLLPTPRGPVVMELELIEPQLFLDLEPQAASRFAAHLIELLP